ncbi:hypothetical protein SAMN05216584_10366 [Selenomonas sp. WCT3]|nr:hypothetical protein SAMN05216584_10366 [Selenomonas ruminantium]
MDWLHRAVKPMDVLIAAVGLYVFVFGINYSDMSIIDTAYAVSFGIWGVLFVVRCYICWKGSK